jgi:hypothetical protein
MPYGGVYRGREPIVENVFGPILAGRGRLHGRADEILPLDETRVIARAGTAARAPPARSTPSSCTPGP